MVGTPTWFHEHEVIPTAMIYLVVGFFPMHTLGAEIRLKNFPYIYIYIYIFHLTKIKKSSGNFTLHKFNHCYFLWLMNCMVYSNSTTL